jgi:catechol 2,3-dioxygenase-like lactoylglutathione lyase family enzyme
MYDHIGFKTANLDASVRFYKAVLAPLGHVLDAHDAAGAGFGPKAAPALWLYAGGTGKGTPVHVGFRAADRAAVEAFHAAGLAAGGQDNGAPGLRSDYSPTYYAAFLIDPDGNNVEAVCMAQEA